MSIPPRSDARKTLLLSLAWAQVAIAAGLFFLSLVADLRAPSFGMRWRDANGVVTEVTPGGPADAAGIVAGDRIVRVDGREVGDEIPPFYFANSNAPVAVTLATPSGVRDVTMIAPTSAENFEPFAGGRTGGIRGTGDALRLLVNAFVLMLAIALLMARPHLGNARIGALALAYYVGGNRLISIPGFGATTEAGDGVRLALHLLDFWYLAGFFALMLHFALIFPEALPALRRHRWLHYAPYIATLPIFMAAAGDSTELLRPGTATFLAKIPAQLLFEIYAPLLMTGVAVLLAVHFRYTADQNDLRRLRLVFVALLPGLATWLIAIQASYLDISPVTAAIVSGTQWVGAAVSVSLLTYAIVRHRLFGIRPLVRKSIQYALARGTLLVCIALPALVLVAFLFVRRHDSLTDLLTQDLVRLLALLVPMVLLLRYRQPLLDTIDRRFFREDYDARHALMRVVSMIERGTDIMVLGRVALLEIEKALHPVHASLWLLDSGDRNFQRVMVIGQDRPAPLLERTDAVLRILFQREAPVEIDHSRVTGSYRRLALAELTWLQTTGASLLVPLAVDREVVGFIVLGDRLSEEPYGTEDRELLTAIAAQLALTEDYGRLEILARRDPLTEALNRHAFYSLLDKKRVFPFQVTGGCVAVVDLNDLKKINDAYGHAAGDAAIRRVASTIRSLVRADDLVFRWGGDEFLIVLFGLSEAEVRTRLAGLNDSILSVGPESHRDVPVTVALGVAHFDDVGGLTLAIDHADRGMYAAKQRARGEHEAPKA
ncbi:MAG: diguanylate cyclase [Thermoanaerobaculia bacterium]